MSLLYTTWEGVKIPLDNITEPQKELLKELFELYNKNPGYPGFANTAYSPDSLKRIGAKLVLGRYYIDKRLAQTEIYRIIQDLETILGIQQGFFADESIDEDILEKNKRTLEEFLK